MRHPRGGFLNHSFCHPATVPGTAGLKISRGELSKDIPHGFSSVGFRSYLTAKPYHRQVFYRLPSASETLFQNTHRYIQRERATNKYTQSRGHGKPYPFLPRSCSARMILYPIAPLLCVAISIPFAASVSSCHAGVDADRRPSGRASSLDRRQRKICRPEAPVGGRLCSWLGVRILLWSFQPGVPKPHGHRKVHHRSTGALILCPCRKYLWHRHIKGRLY